MKIIQDSREQIPYAFNAPRYAGTVVEVGTLSVGDYSLHGLEDRIAIERKSLADLCGTLTSGRERFRRECERGRGLEYFGLVIEASMDDVRRHNYRSAMTPQSLLQTLAAWSVRYGLHVHWCGSREGSEYLTHSLLEKFLKEQQTLLAALVKAHGEAA